MEDFTADLPRPVAALVHITQAMQSASTLGERIQAVLMTTVREMGLKAGTIRLLAPDRQSLRLAAAYGLSLAYLQKGDVQVARSGLDRLVLEGETVVIDDAASDPRFQYPHDAAREGIRSLLVLPLRFGPRVVGVFRVYASDTHRFTPEEVAFLRAVTAIAGLSLENAKLNSALSEIAGAITSSLNLQTVLNTILERSVVEMGFQAGLIRLIDPAAGTLPLVAAYGLSEAYLQKGAVEVARSGLDQRVLANEVVIIDDIATDEGFQYPVAARREGLVSTVSLPLRARDRVLGVLRIYSGVRHHFTDREVRFLTTIANLGAAAIENARLYEALEAAYKGLEADLQDWYRYLT